MKTEVRRPEQPVVLQIEFKSFREARDLMEELMTWKPTGGWSPLATQFLEALDEAAQDED
jgi:hypothetical protein